MRISIAMATYNGAKYLQEQLDSFLAQTRQPDELVVCDDGSRDDTLDILERFQQQAPFEVLVYKNELNLGYKKNFEKALTLCSGDMIFLSDQDDVWHKIKIERIIQEFKNHPATLVVVNDAELTISDLSRTGLTVAGQITSVGMSHEQLLLGCCIAFRSDLKPLILPIPHNLHGHDGWINTLANALGCRRFLPEVLQYYRRHGENTSEFVTTSTKPVRRWHLLKDKMKWDNLRCDPRAASERRLEQIIALRDRLLACEINVRSMFPHGYVKAISEIERILRIYEARYVLQKRPGFSRLAGAFRFYVLGGYRQFEGWKSLLRDIVR